MSHNFRTVYTACYALCVCLRPHV